MLRMTPASSAATTKASGAAAATCAGWYGGVDNVDKYIAGCSARESGNKIFFCYYIFIITSFVKG